MKAALVFTVIAAAYVVTSRSGPGAVTERRAAPREHFIPVGNVQLYSREIGRGQPIVVLHGGPDFDQSYFLPDMDQYSDSFRLIYYDQRGRGKSATGVQPEDVSIESDVADLDRVREYFRLGQAALLGHSWGAVLALEYAVRHPDRVSHLILMNPAPVSAADFEAFRKAYIEELGGDLDRLKAVAATEAFKEGDPDAVAAYYRIHFKPALFRAQDLEKVVSRIKASATKEGVLKARKIEDRLTEGTWRSPGYDLLPKLADLKIPTLVIASDHDFIPSETAEHIAHAIPNARLVTFRSCGHFTYMECPDDVRLEFDVFFKRPSPERP